MTLTIDDSKFLEINQRMVSNNANIKITGYDSKISKVSGASDFSFHSDFSEV